MIKTLATQSPVHTLCHLLEVPRSGYYQWLKGRSGPRAKANEQLLEHIQKAFAQSRQTYGSPRIARQLHAQQVRLAAKTKFAPPHALPPSSVRAKSKRPFRPRTTDSSHLNRIAPNRLKQSADVKAVNKIWVADITYIRTQGGWIYLAAVMDLYSRKIVGWALGYALRTSLVEEALRQALAMRRPAAGLLHHSDRGTQYASSAFQALLHYYKIRPSMSATGHCYDNAAMESFWSTLKTELIHRRDFQDLQQAKSALFEYIEIFYNRKRLHSALGYKSPVDFEQQ